MDLLKNFIQLLIGKICLPRLPAVFHEHFIQEGHHKHAQLPFLGRLLGRKRVALRRNIVAVGQSCENDSDVRICHHVSRLRDECLNRELFANLHEARVILESWRVKYNERRPHSALGYRTPNEYAGRKEDEPSCASSCPPPNPPPLAAAGVRGNYGSTPQGGSQRKTRTPTNPESFSYEVSHLRGHGMIKWLLVETTVGSRGHVAFDLNRLKFSAVVHSMFQMLMVAAGHLLILALAIFGLRLSHRYISSRFIRSSVHCPTQLAAKGQYEAPPRGWNACF